MKGSWKTTAAGVAAILGAIAAAVFVLCDGDPATVVNWPATGAAIAAGWGLIHARDDKVTSEAAGAATKS